MRRVPLFVLLVGAFGLAFLQPARAQSEGGDSTYGLVGLIEERDANDQLVPAEAVRREVRALLRSRLRVRGFTPSRTPRHLFAVHAEPVSPGGPVVLSLLALEPLPPETIAFGKEAELFYADGAEAAASAEGQMARQYVSEEHMYTYGRIYAYAAGVAEPDRLADAVDDALGRVLRWTPTGR